MYSESANFHGYEMIAKGQEHITPCFSLKSCFCNLSNYTFIEQNHQLPAAQT